MSRGSVPVEAASGHPAPSPILSAAGIECVLLPADGASVAWRLRIAGERIVVVVPVDTAVQLHLGDRAGFTDLSAQPGAALLLVGHDRFVAAAAARDGGRMLALSSPRAPIDALIGTPCSSGYLPGSVVLRAGTRFLVDLIEGGDGLESPSTPAMERLLRELIVAVVTEGAGTGPARVPWVGLHDRAVEHIARNRTDQRLSTGPMAKALNVSVRQLQRAFAAVGSTPQREIRRHRALLAASLLGDPAFAPLSIDQISHQCGFRNPADLRRALAHHELPTPRQLRVAALSTPVPGAKPARPSAAPAAHAG